MTRKTPHLLVFGPGYTAHPIMQYFHSKGWKVSASWRREEAKEALNQMGFNPVSLQENIAPDQQDIGDVSHILCSIAPTADGDPVLPILKEWQNQMPALEWIGYLSSTNVYGNHDGGWVNETTICTPSLDRGKRRVRAENDWRDFANSISATIHIFRLAGIYGPGRNAIKSVLTGKAKRIIKAGQIFSRIHVEDICQTVVKAATGGYESDIFNLADDLACPPQDVIEAAADLLKLKAPKAQDFETADLSPMARSFYMESKRVRNDKIKSILGITLKYPTYKVGLAELLSKETS
jgi:nucleoside-diphosphate-sugar epimerase